MVDDGHGQVHGRFTLPSTVGLMLREALTALANPQRHDESELKKPDGTWISTPERLGRAFVEWTERYPVGRVPHHGGINATIVVTMDLRALLTGLGVATLDNGDRITAEAARRLACEAGIIPAVLGGQSQPLDLGRQRRFHTTGQRIALGLRDKGCTAHGCDLPPGVCHAHHDISWSRDGGTSVDNGRLLCPRHHRLIHDQRYDHGVGADNQVTFHRRT